MACRRIKIKEDKSKERDRDRTRERKKTKIQRKNERKTNANHHIKWSRPQTKSVMGHFNAKFRYRLKSEGLFK